MKIIVKAGPRTVTFTQRTKEDLLAKVDNESKKAGLSRNEFINAVLDQVVHDPKFVLRVK